MHDPRIVVNVAQAIREAAQCLAATSDTARLDAELLMAHALGTTRSALLLSHMADPAPASFAALVDRRAACEPVAYLTGAQEFYGRVFAVSRAVLIPRADSESVIAAALQQMGDAGRVLDCGTGSGALLLTLLAERPGWTGTGIDASAEALVVAAANAARLGLAQRAVFNRADWTMPGWADGLGQFDLVIANPPYVETGAALARDVRDYEPHAALFAGGDGLDDYRVLVPQLGALLCPAGAAVLEIGAAQGAAIRALGTAAGFDVRIKPDVAGRDRAAVLTPAGQSGGYRPPAAGFCLAKQARGSTPQATAPATRRNRCWRSGLAPTLRCTGLWDSGCDGSLGHRDLHGQGREGVMRLCGRDAWPVPIEEDASLEQQ